MKIGLLECDHVLPEFRAIAGDYRDMFRAFLPDVEFVFFDVCNGQLPPPGDDCTAYLCTGSRYSVYDDVDWILALKAFVRGLYGGPKKFIGVCFGHQMLGEALGGKVEKAATGWNVGAHTFNIVQQESWMTPFQPRLNVLIMCQDQVVRLPENSTVLARTAACPVAMFRVGERMLGIQGHPEFPVEYEAALLESRRARIGDEKTDTGLASLTARLDGAVAAAWMRRFLEVEALSS